MMMEFTVLASGSSGNASFVRSDAVGVLIDLGLGPRQFETRLDEIGHSWADIHAALLTHTHGDHWNERTLARLRDHRIPLHCHSDHSRVLQARSSQFVQMQAAGLVRYYNLEQLISVAPGLSCLPFQVRHDGGMTCGFRLEGAADFFGQPTVLGFATDLGSWDKRIVQHLTNADILAVEFNHDVVLQKASGRSAYTIARNLGHAGHLSNEQAAALVRAVIANSEPGCPQHVVQLHLSESCNRPVLAQGTLQPIIQQTAKHLSVHLTYANKPSTRVVVGSETFKSRRRKRRVRLPRIRIQPRYHTPFLPGLQE